MDPIAKIVTLYSASPVRMASNSTSTVAATTLLQYPTAQSSLQRRIAVAANQPTLSVPTATAWKTIPAAYNMTSSAVTAFSVNSESSFQMENVKEH